MNRFLVFLLSFFVCFLTMYGQKGYELGGHLGSAWYFGDINNEFRLNSPGLIAGAAMRYNFNERLAYKVGANYILLRGYDFKSDNIFQKARNISFNNHMAELAGQFEVNYTTYKHGSRDLWMTPYLFLGGSVFAHSPKAKFDDTWISLRPLGTEGQKKGFEYALLGGSWLAGLGLKFDLSYYWSINIEIASRQTFTDYIDDTSTKYPNDIQLLVDRGPTAVALSDPSILIPGYNDTKIGVPDRQRGDSDANDSYMTFNVGIMYYFGQVRCPEILKN